MNLRRPELREKGYALEKLPMPPTAREFARARNWDALDACFSEWIKPSGELFQYLQQFHQFSRIETMISVRDSNHEWEEDGIWHDDGSRVFAFSLSLTENASDILGGLLEIQNIETLVSESVPTPEFGTAILFLTGRHGFLHRIRKVEKGMRAILVGWCSE